MPESPRWLMAHDRYDEARMSIARVRGVPIDHDSVSYTFAEMAEDRKIEEASGQGTWKECFVGKAGLPKVAYRTMLGIMLQALQQVGSCSRSRLTPS